MDHPAQRRQRRVGRALSRLHIGQSELAFADLPAPAHRSGAVGRPSRRRHRVGVVRKRIAAVGQRQILAGAGDDRARRPRQCGASGARRLAQRFHVRGHREHGARPVRRAADAGRSQGADGSSALWQRARGRAARRQAARRQSGRPGEGAHRGLQEGLQHQGPARRGSARTAWRSRLHLQQDPAAPPRREIRRGRAADAERAEGPRPPVQSRRMVDRAAIAVAQDARRRRAPHRLSDRARRRPARARHLQDRAGIHRGLDRAALSDRPGDGRAAFCAHRRRQRQPDRAGARRLLAGPRRRSGRPLPGRPRRLHRGGGAIDQLLRPVGARQTRPCRRSS